MEGSGSVSYWLHVQQGSPPHYLHLQEYLRDLTASLVHFAWTEPSPPAGQLLPAWSQAPFIMLPLEGLVWRSMVHLPPL